MNFWFEESLEMVLTAYSRRDTVKKSVEERNFKCCEMQFGKAELFLSQIL